jgi:hypothetical protein
MWLGGRFSSRCFLGNGEGACGPFAPLALRGGDTGFGTSKM